MAWQEARAKQAAPAEVLGARRQRITRRAQPCRPEGKKPAAEQGGSVSSPEITPEYAGTFISDEQHRLEGKAIIYTKDGRKLVRLTDFKADAGAELHAILTKKGAKAAEGKDLGKIAANEPVQELEISASADFNQFNQLILYNPASKTEYGRASLDKF